MYRLDRSCRHSLIGRLDTPATYLNPPMNKHIPSYNRSVPTTASIPLTDSVWLNNLGLWKGRKSFWGGGCL